MKPDLLKLAFLALAIGLSGCATSYGAKTIVPSGYNYNTAIADSKDQQLLLNLVRLRYRDTVVFMNITSVTTQHQYSTGLSAENNIPFRRAGDGASLIIPSAAYSESPTISYAPVTGAEFATNLLSPISAETIVLLANSGWSIERLMTCCVERLGRLSNAPSASGPTPAILPDNQEFRRLAKLLRRLQTKEQVFVEQVAAGDADARETHLSIKAPPGADCEALKRLLVTNSCRVQLKLVARGIIADDALLAQTRTVLGTLYNLSHAVSVPAGHEADGLVTESLIESAGTESWTAFLGGQFQVRNSKDEPSGAFVKIQYRDHWFWIDDSDLESKTTFSLVLFLLSLQSAASEGAAPLLTVNAGG